MPCHSSGCSGVRQVAHMEKLARAVGSPAGRRHCGAAACLEAPEMWEHVPANCLGQPVEKHGLTGFSLQEKRETSGVQGQSGMFLSQGTANGCTGTRRRTMPLKDFIIVTNKLSVLPLAIPATTAASHTNIPPMHTLKP